MPKRKALSYGVGERRSWVISDLVKAWKTFEEVKKLDPNDLEQHFIAGLALQMAGQSDECDVEYERFCKKAEAYHVTIQEAINYYQDIIDKMEEESRKLKLNGGHDEVHPELSNIKSRVIVLTRFQEHRDLDRNKKCVVS
tara:strand:+ start:1038 stop:1457 length:420 start_codon:yes stop_codon:yes gene_type:complete